MPESGRQYRVGHDVGEAMTALGVEGLPTWLSEMPDDASTGELPAGAAPVDRAGAAGSAGDLGAVTDGLPADLGSAEEGPPGDLGASAEGLPGDLDAVAGGLPVDPGPAEEGLPGDPLGPADERPPGDLDAAQAADAGAGSLVRPYTKTGGRTRTDYDLAIETLVSTYERGALEDAALLPEHRSICALCESTRSVAEVAAHLRLPLGVTKVLLGDLAGMGMILIHWNDTVIDDQPSGELMERVLSGLRRL